MAYTIGQYKKIPSQDDTEFMSFYSGTPIVDRYKRKRTSMIGEDLGEFEDEVLKAGNTGTYYLLGNSYYLHCKIKKRASTQTFYVYLTNTGQGDSVKKVEQYITEINVPGGYSTYTGTETAGNPEGWYDVEFTFTPAANADTLLFRLVRTKEDYSVSPRYAKIVYEELSVMENFLEKKSDNFSKMSNGLIKMGIQSRPHLWMFINDEEIHCDRSGIYEVKNGLVLVNSFTVVKHGDFVDENIVNNTIKTIDANLPDKDEKPEDPTQPDPRTDESWKDIYSVSLINYAKTRTVDSFTMDYMYKQKTDEATG